MRKTFSPCYLMMVAVLVAGFMFLAAGCIAQPQHHGTSSQEESLKRFLREYLKDPRIDNDETTRYFPALVDLKDDGREEVISYTLEGRFEQHPARQFSVADEVTKWQAEGRL